MVSFSELEIFLLGAAWVLDTALLLILLDRNNRRRIVAPLLLLVLGAWLFHTGAWGQSLLYDNPNAWAARLYWLLLMTAAAGLLLMPCAMLHGVLRATLTGIDPHTPADRRYLWLYLPLLGLLAVGWRLQSDTSLDFTAQLSAWVMPYMLGLTAVNTASGLIFLRTYPRFVLHWNRAFVHSAGWALLALALIHSVLFFIALPLWPMQQALWQLLAALTPIPLILLVSYFIIRFNFMQLVLERVVIYGALLVAAVLFHQVFLQDVWEALSDRFKINFAIVEGIALTALVLLVRPLRQRSAEALRYLLGQPVSQFRRQTRQFAQRLVDHSDDSVSALLDWFCRAAPEALDVSYCALWLLDAQGTVVLRAGSAETRLSDTEVQQLMHDLRARNRLACRPADAPSVSQGDRLLALGAAAAVLLEHPSVQGLCLLGRGGGDMHEERLNALILVAEQLALTIHGSQLQAQRLQAERRALQNDKLSALGLVAGSIAHEVKNPISSLKTIASVMREELPANSPHAEDLDLMLNELNRLHHTVNRLLQFARPPKAGAQTAVLSDEAEVLLQILRHLARQKNIELRCRLEPSLPELAIDPNSLREILFNLLGNAIEAAGSWVSLQAKRTGHQVEISVADDGPGIDETIRSQLFQAFVTGKEQGTGLGLYLVGLRVREAGGQIDCASNPRGTTFTLSLPVCTAAKTAASAYTES